MPGIYKILLYHFSRSYLVLNAQLREVSSVLDTVIFILWIRTLRTERLNNNLARVIRQQMV